MGHRQKASQVGGELSGGDQQMLTIAPTLMGNPVVIILEEPSDLIKQCKIYTRRHHKNGVRYGIVSRNDHGKKK